jgi:hypothetical protein
MKMDRRYLAILPAVGFWVALIIWLSDHRPGENYGPMTLTILFFFLAVTTFILSAGIAMLDSLKKRRVGAWWVIAAANTTPWLGFVVLQILAYWDRIHDR